MKKKEFDEKFKFREVSAGEEPCPRCHKCVEDKGLGFFCLARRTPVGTKNTCNIWSVRHHLLDN